MSHDERKKGNLPFEIVIETIAHHEFLNWDDYIVHGNRAKRNPPLRDEKMQRRILEKVVRGETDIIGDDHAPHELSRKDSESPPSGDPAIAFLPKRVQMLRELGIDERHLEDLLFNTGNRIFFNGELNRRVVNAEYNPELWRAYGWNPFSRIDGT